MPGLVEIPTLFHYIKEEQKAASNPETDDSLKGLESTASCRVPLLITPWVFIAEQATAKLQPV